MARRGRPGDRATMAVMFLRNNFLGIPTNFIIFLYI